MKKSLFFLLLALFPAMAWAAFDGTKYYTINRNGEAASCMYQNGANIGIGALTKDDGAYYWQLEPTANADCYYIKNALTGQYVQTSVITLSSLISMGDDPVEYVISHGANTSGYYFLASNDQTINYNSDSSLGLNKGANGVVAYYITTGRGNSYWEIKEADYVPSDPEVSTEEEDVAPNVAAYRLPCGTLSTKTYLSTIDIQGEGVLGELHYIVSAPTSRHTLYLGQRLEVAKGGKAELSATMVGANVKGAAVTVYADFDGDCVFEQTVHATVQENITAALTVPSATKAQKGRIRIRVDQSGSVGANADVYGVCYDFPVYIRESDGKRLLKVAANGSYRGTVCIEGYNAQEVIFERGTEVTVSASSLPGYRFSEWRKGRNVVATTSKYTTSMTENKELVAYFVPKSGDDAECLRFTFSNTHTAPVIMVTDQDGNVVEGVSATVTLSPEQYQKNSGTAMSAQTDLTPASSRDQGADRLVTFCIYNMPEDYYYKSIRAKIAAVTSLGAFSTKSIREFDFSVSTGSSPESLVLLGSLNGVNINVDGTAAGDDNSHFWTFTGDQTLIPTNPLYVQVNMVNNTGYAVYSSLFALDILKSDQCPEAIPGIFEDKTESPVLFDLHGRRIVKPTPGLYITSNGKKQILK